MEASEEKNSSNVYCRKTFLTEQSQNGRKPSELFDSLIIFVPFIVILLLVQPHLSLDYNSDTINVSFKNRHFVEAIFSSGLATFGYKYSPMVKHSWLLIVPWMTKAIRYWFKSSYELINMNLDENEPEAVNLFLRWSLTASARNEDANLLIEKVDTYGRKHFIVGILFLQNIIVIIFVLTTFRRLKLTMAIQSFDEERENAGRL